MGVSEWSDGYHASCLYLPTIQDMSNIVQYVISLELGTASLCFFKSLVTSCQYGESILFMSQSKISCVKKSVSDLV